MTLQAGRLDKLVTLYHRVLTPNEQGENVVSFPVAYATVWAEKRDMHGQRRFQAREFFEEQMTEFTIRWRDDVLLTDQLVAVESNQIYEIVQSSEITRHEGLDLLCRAVVP